MKPFVAIRMEEDAVVSFVSSSQAFPHNVMTVPSCERGDFLGAERAETVLLFPEVEQFPSPFQVVCHFHIETLFKVGLPFGIIWISFVLDFDVSFDNGAFSLEQSNRLSLSFLSKDFSIKDPV